MKITAAILLFLSMAFATEPAKDALPVDPAGAEYLRYENAALRVEIAERDLRTLYLKRTEAIQAIYAAAKVRPDEYEFTLDKDGKPILKKRPTPPKPAEKK